MENNTLKFVVVLHGPMGAGKTTTSNLLQGQIVPSARVALPDVRRMVSGGGRGNGDLAREVMLDMTEIYLKRDIPVIIETVCGKDFISRCKEIARLYKCPCFVYRIVADENSRWSRVCERTRLMMNVEVLSEDKKTELRSYFEENKEFYNKQSGDVGKDLDSSYLSSEEVVSLVVKELRELL